MACYANEFQQQALKDICSWRGGAPASNSTRLRSPLGPRNCWYPVGGRAGRGRRREEDGEQRGRRRPEKQSSSQRLVGGHSEWLLFSCPVMSDSLQPHGLQHSRPLWPSPSPKVDPSSCPLISHAIHSERGTVFPHHHHHLCAQLLAPSESSLTNGACWPGQPIPTFF